MAIDSYMAFQTYGPSNSAGTFLQAESQVTWGTGNTEPLAKQPTTLTQGYVFEIEDYSFDVEQTLNIGSQGGGAGAGKITFNPFSITRKIDRASPIFFEMACSGTAFCQVTLALRKSAGVGAGAGDTSGQIYLRFDFKLVAVKTISWSHDDESPKEEVTFEYGGLQIRYCPQLSSGDMGQIIPAGWNRVTNTRDQGNAPLKSNS
jgi:type VI secretion system secreted protein Hcp